jgi:hypothetical protein
VSGQTQGAAVPTGNAGVSVDGSFVADVSLTNGSMSYNDTSTLAAGLHTITASYNGDSTYASKSFSVTHSVSPPTYPTHTTLITSPSTLMASQTLRLTAVVSAAVPIPNGIITFLDGTATLGSSSIDSTGTASFDTALLAAGVHSLSAKFEGYTSYGFGFTQYVSAVFEPSTSPAATVTVTAVPTTITLEPSASSIIVGSVVTFSMQLSSNAGIPFGGVTLYDGATPLGSISLNSNGSASFSTASLAVGSHNITAAYTANGPYAGDVSSALPLVVTPAPLSAVTTMVSLAPQQTWATGTSALIAFVWSPEAVSGGAVVFLDSGKILGTARVDVAGIARLTNVKLESGTHLLAASFEATARYAPSASPVLTERWPSAGPEFSLVVVPSGDSRATSSSTSLIAEIAPQTGFQGLVSLSCFAGFPRDYSCSFSPGSVAGAGNSLLTVAASPKSAGIEPSPAGWSIAAGLLLLFFVVGGAPRGFRFAALLIVVLAAPIFSGCASSGRPLGSAAQQTVVLTIQATSGQGSQEIIHSSQVLVRLAVRP